MVFEVAEDEVAEDDGHWNQRGWGINEAGVGGKRRLMTKCQIECVGWQGVNR